MTEAEHPEIGREEVDEFRRVVDPLVGAQLSILKIPAPALREFEPSQVGTITGTLMDACIAQLDRVLDDGESFAEIGFRRAAGLVGEREGYPDLSHELGYRAELKLLYVDPEDIEMKSPPTPREPSARVDQKVTVKNVDPSTDLLLVLAYQLQPHDDAPDLYSPTIIDAGCFPMIEVVRARDHRLRESGGKWFGDYDTPAILSQKGREKLERGKPLNEDEYGRKAGEGYDYNEDTNFGKLKRIPYRPLQEFLRKHDASYAKSGSYPEEWRLE